MHIFFKHVLKPNLGLFNISFNEKIDVKQRYISQKGGMVAAGIFL